MKAFKFFIILVLLIIVSCKSKIFICGLSNGPIIPNFRLDNFNQIFDEFGQPKSVIFLDSNKRFSPDNKFYLDFSQKKKLNDKKVLLFDSNKKLICKLKGVSRYESIIWLDNSLIFDGGSAPEPRKIVVNLKSGKVTRYNTKGWFMFIGQTNEKAYFVSHSDYAEINRTKIRSAHSIISINENGTEIVHDNKSCLGRILLHDKGLKYRWFSYSKDTVYFFQFFNPQLCIKCVELKYSSTVINPLRIDFIVNDSIQLSPEIIPKIYTDEHSQYTEGKTFIIVPNYGLFVSDGKQFRPYTKIDIDKMIGWVREFRIYGKYIVFKTQNMNYELINEEDKLKTRNKLNKTDYSGGFDEIAILNIETNEISYPEIKYK